MRLPALAILLLIPLATSIAQETNFSEGPQYLMTTGNTLLLRSIATPSLNLSSQTLAGTTDVPRPIETPAFASAETIVYLSSVYWGDHVSEQDLARRLETPSATADQTARYMNYVADQVAGAYQTPVTEAAEFAPGPLIVELTGGATPANLPASIFDTGVTGMSDTQSPQQRGFGMSLGEVAAYWKSHKRQSPRVFTNQDLRRR